MTTHLRRRVLLVEDYADAREMYAMVLRLEGFDVGEAADGLEAVALAVTLTPDVIVMDLSLPGLDGRAAARHIKADPRTAAVPIVALTGATLSDPHQEFAQVLTKPCAPHDLAAALHRLFTVAD